TQRRRRWSRGRVSTPGVRLPYQVQRRTTAVSYRLLVGWNGSSLGQLDPSRLAEAEGFEPPVGFPTVAFKATAFGRSATPPRSHRVAGPPPHGATGKGEPTCLPRPTSACWMHGWLRPMSYRMNCGGAGPPGKGRWCSVE